MKKKDGSKKSSALYRQRLKAKKPPLLRTPTSIEVDVAKDLGVLHDLPTQTPQTRLFHCVEIFAGAGGLALAASNAGFEHDAVLEYNHDACETIHTNQRRGYELVRHWPLIEADVYHQDFTTWQGRVDLVSGGPPCQPFSIGGKHRAMTDRRN